MITLKNLIEKFKGANPDLVNTILDVIVAHPNNFIITGRSTDKQTRLTLIKDFLKDTGIEYKPKYKKLIKYAETFLNYTTDARKEFIFDKVIPIVNPNKIDFYEKKELLGQLLFKNLGLFRSDSEMQNLLNTLNDLSDNIEDMGIGDKSIKYNKNLVEFIEFRNMLKVSLLVTISAISRVESRGNHFRLDYPNQNEDYEKNSLIINSKNAIEFESLI